MDINVTYLTSYSLERSNVFRPASHPARARLRLGSSALAILITAVGLSGSATPPPSLVGTWILTGAPETRADGTTGQTFGPDPKGLLIINESGRYSLQIFRPDRPKFASGDKRKGTAEEYQAAVVGMSSHYGRCFIDPVSNALIFQIDLASYPNWDGTEQKREYQLSGDDLTYRVPASASGTGTVATSSWRRIRE